MRWRILIPVPVATTLRQLLPSTTTPGGRCLDGTMAGYFIHKGTDPELFVIYLKGGGACYDEDSCTKRAKTALGSSVSVRCFLSCRYE